MELKELMKFKIKEVLKEFPTMSLTQRRHINKLIKLYSPLVKSPRSLEALIDAIRTFIKGTFEKDALKVRNCFISFTTYKKEDYTNKMIIIRNKNNKKGSCKVEKDAWGRTRVLYPTPWINARNKELKNKR